MFSWFTLASNPCIISLIPWPQDIHWQWVPRVNWLLYSFGGANLNNFPFLLQLTSLTWPSMRMGQHLPRSGLWYFKAFQDYSWWLRGSSASYFVLGLALWRKYNDVSGGHAEIFYSARKKTKINTKTAIKYCRGSAELPPSLHHPVCPGHMVPPQPQSPVISIHSREN